jgi:hypothetical protein
MTERVEPDIDRRKASNALLRELVNALKRFTAARDAMWDLSLFDRIFRMDKCEQALMAHEAAVADLKKTIQAMARAGSAQAAASRRSDQVAAEPLITPEELEALLSPNGLLDPDTPDRGDDPARPFQSGGAWIGPAAARPSADGRETAIAAFSSMTDKTGDAGVATMVADLSLSPVRQGRESL